LSTAAWIGVASGVVVIVGAVLGYARFMVQAPLVAQNARLETAKAQVEASRGDLERVLGHEQERVSDLDARYRSLHQDFMSLKLEKTGVLLKYEIDTELREAMDELDVTESSILVPGPPPNSSTFVFLAIYGPVAGKLRKAKLPTDQGIVGRVFRTGTPHRTANAYHDPSFFSGIDEKSEHETRALLTLPLRHDSRIVGVAQFLNKPGGFTASDERLAEELARPLTAKVAAFAQDPENFEVLGMAWRSKDKEATIAFCDLTSFSTLLTQMNVPSAIDCVNEYLEQQCDIAMRFGGTIDKYIGDGAMLRFNVPRPITTNDHAVCAAEAALDMRKAYDRLRKGWSSGGLPVRGVYGRIGLASGPVYEATIGHPNFPQITVIGEAVNVAANLCETAPRTRDVILVDQSLRTRLNGRFEFSEDQSDRNGSPVFELLSGA
jgi:class 3 adenylate cyclase